jgi:hypothetical protein
MTNVPDLLMHRLLLAVERHGRSKAELEARAAELRLVQLELATTCQLREGDQIEMATGKILRGNGAAATTPGEVNHG